MSCLAHHLGASRKLTTCCMSRLVHRLDASQHAHGALCTLSTHPERADLSCLAHHLGASRKLSTCCVSRLVHRLDASPHAHGALAHAPIAFDPTRGCIAIGTGAQSCRGSGASRRLLIATHPHIPTVAGQALPPPFTDTTHNSPYAPFSHPPSYARASLHRCAGMRGVTEGCPH